MHIPVLQNEVVEYLNPKPNENFIDATLGFAGHAKSILEKTKPRGKVLGIELDQAVFKQVKNENIERLILENGSYQDIKKIVARHNFNTNGILLDLGFSSWHIDDSNRGFSFQKNEPLDMRYNQSQDLTAYRIVNSLPKKDIADILKDYGEEKFADRIAREIVNCRRKQKIKTTMELVNAIKLAIPVKLRRSSRIHFATKTFQALRIAVNNELGALEQVLPEALDMLPPKGRFVIISFHSLEDRIVKHFFKQAKEKGEVEILTKKPIMAQLNEIAGNNRARSAKLRAVIKL